jgi:O-succinylbenzoate synthase
MRIAFSPYTLTWKHSGNLRKGALIRMETEDGVGYADCHPWEEFGDAPLKNQIQALQEGALTPLLKQTLTCARIDAQARQEKRLLLASLKLPQSHLLIHRSDMQSLEEIVQKGIKLLKIKVRPHDQLFLKENSPLLNIYGMKWRLDFNGQFTFASCQKFLHEIEPCLTSIDLIEDPCPYNTHNWLAIQNQFGIPLACDFAFPDDPHPFIVIHKPCTRSLSPNTTQARVIVTSSLGHPLGQLMAAYVGATLPQAREETGGFLSHLVYKTTPFSAELQIEQGRLLPVPGTGLGFDALLEEQVWISIGNQ